MDPNMLVSTQQLKHWVHILTIHLYTLLGCKLDYLTIPGHT